MSTSLGTLSPSKHIIVVSPFKDNDEQNRMKKGMIEQVKQEEVEENGNTSNNINSNHVEEIESNEKLALKCDKTSSNSTPKSKERSFDKWRDQRINVSTHGAGDHNKVNQDPEVEIISISIKCRDRPDIVLSEPFASSPKACLFTLKEGSRYRLRFSFIVSNKTVSGLKYVNTLWKAGVRVDRSEVRLGSFSPKQEPYSYELEEDTAPSGIFVRGLYCARTKVVDDQERCYLDIKYYFEIQKTWSS